MRNSQNEMGSRVQRDGQRRSWFVDVRLSVLLRFFAAVLSASFLGCDGLRSHSIFDAYESLSGDQAALPSRTEVPLKQVNFASLDSKHGFWTVTVHITTELFSRGCDIFSPTSLQCQVASSVACRSRGYAHGIGITGYYGNLAELLCVSANSGTYAEFPYSGSCAVSDPVSLSCQSLARRSCQETGQKIDQKTGQSTGFVSSSGVVAANASVIGTVCLPKVAAPEVSATLDELRASSTDGFCSRDSIVKTGGCQLATGPVCRQRGFDRGLQATEYASASGSTLFSCVKLSGSEEDIKSVVTPNLGETTERSLQLDAKGVGTMQLGGPSFFYPGGSGDIILRDTIVNRYSFPVLIKGVKSFTNFVSDLVPYQRDSCFNINYATAGEDNEHGEGEVFCTYSTARESPSIDFHRPGAKADSGSNFDRAFVLNPGDRFSHQGTPQWGSRGPNQEWNEITFEKLGDSKIVPVRSIRFPQLDESYEISPGTSVNLPAGCNKTAGGCARDDGRALKTMAGEFPSNGWYVSRDQSAVRGVSVFYNAGAGGQVRFCLRVVLQGGAPLSSPRCYTLDGSNPSPLMFDRGFGANQKGNSFLPLDIDVPAGALIGIDFTLMNKSADVATWVYLDQRYKK